MTWTHLLWIALGGALGAVTRALIGHWLPSDFPWATLLVNVLGSFIIGIILGWEHLESSSVHHAYRTFIGVGFCGALTTFSTFSFQTISLFRQGHIDHGLYNIALSVGLTLLAVWLGVKCAQWLSAT